MSGLNHFEGKQRKATRRRNHIAKDLTELKYRNRIRESIRQHLIDECHEREAEEELSEFMGKLGYGSKE